MIARNKGSEDFVRESNQNEEHEDTIYRRAYKNAGKEDEDEDEDEDDDEDEDYDDDDEDYDDDDDFDEDEDEDNDDSERGQAVLVSVRSSKKSGNSSKEFRPSYHNR